MAGDSNGQEQQAIGMGNSSNRSEGAKAAMAGMKMNQQTCWDHGGQQVEITTMVSTSHNNQLLATIGGVVLERRDGLGVWDDGGGSRGRQFGGVF